MWLGILIRHLWEHGSDVRECIFCDVVSRSLIRDGSDTSFVEPYNVELLFLMFLEILRYSYSAQNSKRSLTSKI